MAHDSVVDLNLEYPKLGIDDKGQTVLPKDSAAIAWSPEFGFFLLLPPFEENQAVPQEVVFLSAILVKSRDTSFMEEIISEFNEGLS